MSNSLKDLTGGSNLNGGARFSFTEDRFCVKNSALNLKDGGYVQVPEGIYFSNDFTITAWIYLFTNKLNLFQFANANSNNNITITLTNSNISFQILQSVNSSIVVPISLNLFEWYFVSFVLSSKTGYIYVNGNQIANRTLNVTLAENTTSNFFGNSNQDLDINQSGNIDEIKIYKGALSSNAIQKEYISTNHDGI